MGGIIIIIKVGADGKDELKDFLPEKEKDDMEK